MPSLAIMRRPRQSWSVGGGRGAEAELTPKAFALSLSNSQLRLYFADNFPGLEEYLHDHASAGLLVQMTDKKKDLSRATTEMTEGELAANF